MKLSRNNHSYEAHLPDTLKEYEIRKNQLTPPRYGQKNILCFSLIPQVLNWTIPSLHLVLLLSQTAEWWAASSGCTLFARVSVVYKDEGIELLSIGQYIQTN